MLEINKIYQGDCLELMKFIDDNSINCCVTSPPYWALRDYQTEDLIWDGDSNCEHDWFEIDILRKTTQGDKPSVNSKVAIHRTTFENRPGKPSNFCSKCGAWRGSFGLEPTFELYIKHLCDIFDEVKRVLRNDGTLWVVIGDTYGGTGTGQEKSMQSKNKQTSGQYELAAQARNIKNQSTKGKLDKSLIMIPFRFAIEMVNRGWILRNTIIWHKANCMPASVKDRFTVDFEYLFFFVKNKKYYFKQQFEPHTRLWDESNGGNFSDIGHKKGGKIETKNTHPKGYPLPNPNGRNKRTVWQISTKPFKEAHFAVYPPELVETPIKAGCPENGIVLDPFMGSGTTACVSLQQNKNYIGIELNQEYIEIANKRIAEFKQQMVLV